MASGAGPVVIKLDGPATTALLRGEAVQGIASNPRVVQGAVMSVEVERGPAGVGQPSTKSGAGDLVTS